MHLLRPALAYTAVSFAMGFLLGTGRVLFIAPAIGPFAAVALELPLMLAVSWLAAGKVLQRWPLPDRASRLGMGIVAFLLLMGAELALGRWGFGQSWVQLAYGLMKPAGMLGLAGQIGFGLIPLIRR
ncbi:hypothetical protein L0V05_13730 [Tabrizicola sp. J26]|uniref:hypothetical protein n=1 Tax=Alitabrizicola rongguiensis TaxID=2909234 RepID=UPI001F3A0F02|nr:hypothetical protein [Tabrizicola rongguiensis]MCF1709875.1 hypothetical protein [Tabrizicola rongguiensis]